MDFDYESIFAVVAPALLLILEILKTNLPRRFYDGRTIRNRRLRHLINVVLIVLAVVTALIYVRAHMFAREQAVQLDQQSEQLHQMNDKWDSLVALYGPIAKLAMERFPDSSSAAAIIGITELMRERIAESEKRVLGTAAEMFNRGKYQSLDTSISERIVENLRSLRINRRVAVNSVLIRCHDCGGARLLYSRDLAYVIQRAGYVILAVDAGPIFGRRGSSPIKCGYAPGNGTSATEFIKAISPLLNCNVDTLTVPGTDSMTLEFVIYGSPQFLPDGRRKLD
jgi:hypothetical protein